MKPRDWLIVGARLIGIWYLTLALLDLRDLIDVWLKIYIPIQTTASAYLETFLFDLFIGIFLFLFSPRLIDLVDPRPNSTNPPTNPPN